MLKSEMPHHGDFEVEGRKVWGELTLSGTDTKLILRSGEDISPEFDSAEIRGVIDGRFSITCVNCVGGIQSVTYGSDSERLRSWKFLPYHVVMGTQYFSSSNDEITAIRFTTKDLHHIFDDQEAFGTLPSSVELQKALSGLIEGVEVTEQSRVAYFVGNERLLDVQLPFGKLIVKREVQPISRPLSVSLTSKLFIYLEFDAPYDLTACSRRIAEITRFLSLIAGRTQYAEDISLNVKKSEGQSVWLGLYSTLSVEGGLKQSSNEPSFNGIPLDGIRRANEFSRVIQEWFSSDEHFIPRVTLFTCVAKDGYSPERLVAAANMFDLTKSLTSSSIPLELGEALSRCLEILAAAPRSDTRDSVVESIKRVGAPTLLAKTKATGAIVQTRIALPKLDLILRQAVLFRNYLVHGGNDSRFKYEIASPYLAFLTDTLEFIFAASELIACGWDANAWWHRPKPVSHWFGQFIKSYFSESASFLDQLEKEKCRTSAQSTKSRAPAKSTKSKRAKKSDTQ